MQSYVMCKLLSKASAARIQFTSASMAGQQALATGSIGVERQSIGMGLFQSSETCEELYP